MGLGDGSKGPLFGTLVPRARATLLVNLDRGSCFFCTHVKKYAGSFAKRVKQVSAPRWKMEHFVGEGFPHDNARGCPGTESGSDRQWECSIWGRETVIVPASIDVREILHTCKKVCRIFSKMRKKGVTTQTQFGLARPKSAFSGKIRPPFPVSLVFGCPPFCTFCRLFAEFSPN